MRVGILSQWFPPETGPATIPGVLARGLAARGHAVTVLTGFPNYPTGALYDGFRMRPRQDSVQDGYAIRRVGLYPDHSSSIPGRLLNYGSFAMSATALGTSAMRGIDALWVYNSPATVALPMWLSKARFHVPILLHNMDMWPDSVIQTGFAPKRGSAAVVWGLSAWVDAMYRAAALVAHLTPTAGVELQRRGVPRSKLRLAPIWIDETTFRPLDGSHRRMRLGYSDDDVVIGYAGALGKAQGVVDLVKSVVALPKSSRVKCLILGSGTEAHAISQIAATHASRVRFLGQVPHTHMGEYAAVPDISYVGLSRGGQAALAYPSKIPAIMACGKPILASAAGDTAELIRASGSGVIIPPGDSRALLQALQQVGCEQRSTLAAWGRLARKYYDEHLSSSAGLDRLEGLLRETAATSL